MNLKYSYFGRKLLRPVIPVELSYKNKKLPYNVLIDSGADFCLFNYEVANHLGIPIETGEKSEAIGITGFGSPIYIHTVNLKVKDKLFRIKAGFLENMTNAGYGIVGQVGFFDKFKVIFDYQNGDIELIEKKKKPQRTLFWSTLLKK